MDNFEFLKKYEQLQTGIMFDSIIELDFASVSLCEKDSSSFWNRALVNTMINKKQLSKIEKTMGGINRTPALYFEKRDDINVLQDFLEENKYKFDFEDSWMFWGGREIDKNSFDKIKKVISEDDLEIFLQTFDASHREGDPQNPYGELGDYLKVTKNVWQKNKDKNKLEYYIAYEADCPVAVATLTNASEIGYISNVGSLQEVRGKGFGKLITLYCVEQSKRYGNREHCLATEEGDYPNEFYKRIGFETRFTALGYIKSI